MKVTPYLISALAALTLTACNPKTSTAERAGENMDTATEKAMGKPVDITDGPMENAGEAVDAAAHNTAKAADDVAAKAKIAAEEAKIAAQKTGARIEAEVDEAD